MRTKIIKYLGLYVAHGKRRHIIIIVKMFTITDDETEVN